MLPFDDPNVLKQRDPQDALGFALGQHALLKRDFGVKLEPKPINNVVLAGIGGSALPGYVVPVWPGVTVPFETIRSYDVPAYVDSQTLFISSSYSGNTEESLSAIDQALQRGAQVVVLAAGGKLAETAREKQLSMYMLPTGIQPRMTTFAFVAAITDILQQYGVAAAGTAELSAAADWLGEQMAKWSPDVPTEQNYAKQIAEQLAGKTLIVYGGPLMTPAAWKWKICCNENAKNLAWTNQYPEFNHNEFIGWSSHPVEKPFAVVEIRSNLEHERVQKRFEVTERLLSGMRPSPIVVQPQGSTVLRQILWAMALGDTATIYLAILNGVNPIPVDLVEKLKVEMAQ